MTQSNLLRRLLGGIMVVAISAAITFSGCTQVDNTLGSDLTLENQALKLGQMDFSGLTSSGDNFFSSRLYITDSLNTAMISYGFLGTMQSDTFGMRQSALYTQYITSYSVEDEDEFGFMPIYDSSVLYITVSGYGGDTSVVQRFEVFEVIDDSFVTESADTVFFPNFDIAPYLASEPVYTFSFPDQDNNIFVETTTIRLEDTPQTAEFMERLMLINKTGDYDYEIYDDDESWVEYFKGLYIRPVESLAAGEVTTPGAIYYFALDGAGFGFYGRNREESDPTLIKDTIGMTYAFYSSYAEAGNVSINCIVNDYDGSEINLADVKSATNTDVPETSVLRVSGMCGVVSEITFANEFFEQLDTILETEEAQTGEVYTSLFFNQATLKIYMEEVNGYDSSLLDPFVVVDVMDRLPTKLGLYTNYSNYYYYEDEDDDDYYTTLSGVADYLYSYESSYTLDFSGELNRSWGCYVLNIPNHIQSIWNSYLSLKEEAEENGTEVDWESIWGRTVYLAPTASNLFSTKYASLQAGDPTFNSAPMQLELTYTMIR